MTESGGRPPNFLSYFSIRRSPGFPNRNHISAPTAFLLLSPSAYDNMDS
jgi:hypothetical protein